MVVVGRKPVDVTASGAPVVLVGAGVAVCGRLVDPSAEVLMEAVELRFRRTIRLATLRPTAAMSSAVVRMRLDIRKYYGGLPLCVI